LVGLFVGVAIAQGIGDPEVPDGDVAVIEDAPDEIVTAGDLDAAIKFLAAGQGLREPPAPDDPQYAQYVQAATSDAILSHWVRGEAAERGIEVFDREIDQRLEQVINDPQQFGSQQAFDRYLERTGITVDQVRERIGLTELGQRIQDSILPEDVEVTGDEIETYYDENRAQFEQPELRDVREILTETEEEANEAREALGENPDAKTWDEVAREFSTDEATNRDGGLRPGVAEGQSEGELEEQIFAAPLDEVVGPFETNAGFYVIQVEKIEPASTQSLEEATETITQILRGSREQQLAGAFQEDFISKWRSRTFCGEDYLIERCSNAEPPPDPCTEELAEETGCGAAVPSRPVIEPGSAGVLGSPAPLARPQGPIIPSEAAAPVGPGLIPTPGAVPQAPPGGQAPQQAPPGG
jgi:foldase protein PrsA